jgi:hypothetical protein
MASRKEEKEVFSLTLFARSEERVVGRSNDRVSENNFCNPFKTASL